MSLNLKVSVPAQGVTKIMRFAETMSVHEVTKQIAEKTGLGGKDHAMFQPASDAEKATSCGRWLKAERTLEYYDLKTNDLIEYKKKHDVIKVKLVDDTIKTVLVDLSLPVVEVVDLIGKKLSLRNADEFSLQQEQKPGVWLKNNQCLTEQVPSLDQLFYLRKKFFVNDANVDQEDPVQLHLVYCQSRDDIISGNHPATKDEAINFAALQLQIQLGDFKPDVHKPGTVPLREYLSPQWQKKDLEKFIFSEWKKLVGMNETNARFRYVQLCRSLKTYGMTVFKVRERVPGKKKLMDGLLCFTRDTIIRMEFESKKVIKEYPFKHLLRWAASPETFTMDFGAYEEDYVVVVTTDGEAISNLIAGYIDLMLKKQRDTGVVIEDDDAEVAEVSSVARLGGMATTSTTTSNVGGNTISYSQGANDCNSGAKAIEKMISDLFGEVAKINDNSLTPAQRRQQIEQQARGLSNLAETLEQMAKTADRTAMASTAHKITAAVEQLINAARQAHATGADPDRILLDASKGVGDALRHLLNAAQNAANKPNDPEAKEALARAQQAAVAALQKLQAASRGVFADEGFQQLFRELARAVNAESQDILQRAHAAMGIISDPIKRQQLEAALQSLGGADEHFARITEMLAPVASDSTCKGTIEKSGRGLEQNAAYVIATAKASGVDPLAAQALAEAQRRMAEALANLLGATDLPDMRGAKEAEDFTEAAQAILQATAALMAANGNPDMIKQHSADVKNAATRLGQAGKALIATQSDPASKERLANYLKAVVEGTKKLLEAVPGALQNPNDPNAQKRITNAAGEVAEATQQLIGDTGKQVAMAALYSSAKVAAATTTKLCTASKMANASMNDPSGRQQLSDAAKNAADAVQKLVGLLRNAQAGPSPSRRTTIMRRPTANGGLGQAQEDNQDILAGAEQFAPVAYKLVSTAKAVSGQVNEDSAKQELIYSSSNAAKAIHKMLSNRKALKAVKGQMETAEAWEEFKAAQADLESALISADTGILQPIKPKDVALQELAAAIAELGQTTKGVAAAARSSPEDLGDAMKKCAAATTKAVSAATALAANIDDKILQKAILNNLKAVTVELKNMMQVAKAVASNPEDNNLNQLLMKAGKGVADALVALTEASKGVIPKKVEDFQEKASNDIEDLAEKELVGAAQAIERCVAKLNAATEAARQRAQEKGLDIDEQNVTEAILEAAQAIAKSTAILVNAATAVQQEFQKMVKQPETRSVYKRDPQWAQGLISAARTVAGAVQHLVKAANSAAQGTASEEELIVAAQAVSAATAQLVTASTVKLDPNSQTQVKLRDASSKVAAATQQLVQAAKAAASWEAEKGSVTSADDQYNLTETKIKEMEQQMAILRLEKELEKARGKLSTMRKAEYSDANKDVSKQAAPPVKRVGAPAGPSAAPGGAPSPVRAPGGPAPAGGAPGSRPLPRPAGAAPGPNNGVPPPRPASGVNSNIPWKQSGLGAKK